MGTDVKELNLMFAELSSGLFIKCQICKADGIVTSQAEINKFAAQHQHDEVPDGPCYGLRGLKPEEKAS